MAFVIAMCGLGIASMLALFIGYTIEIARMRRGVHPPAPPKKDEVIQMPKKAKVWLGKSAMFLLLLLMAVSGMVAQSISAKVSDQAPSTDANKPAEANSSSQVE